MRNKFDYEIDIHGACAIATQPRLHPACSSDGEIDFHVRELKSDLDALALRMKKALKENSSESLFDGDKDV